MEASDNRHDQAKGTLIILPSSRDAVIESSVISIEIIRGSIVTAMV